MTYRKPLPHVDPETRPYWEGARRHELLIQRCLDCGTYRFYPRAHCIRCLSDRAEWIRSMGRGTIYSYTVVRQNRDPRWVADVPYNVVLVDMEEGVRLMSTVVDCPPEQLEVGMQVEVVFDDVAEEITLPKFRVRA